tara:strand:- start:614 stop:820 length:207 start_codon:yes stop_codon:yes gene_type:complete
MEEKNNEPDIMETIIGLEQKERFLDFSTMQDNNNTIVTNAKQEESKTKKDEVKNFINYLYKQFQKGGA